MKKHIPSESGQALVIIAFAVLGLVALTALAIDSGNVYSDRRNAQNAADTAVMAGALSYVRTINWSTATTAALQRAQNNGYNNDGTSNTVEVHNPPIEGPYADCGNTEFNCVEYIQVIITSNVDTYFAPIVGITELTNRVSAVARVEPTYPDPFLPGSAVVTLNEHECPAVVIGGSADVILEGGGGIFINSDCSDNPSKKAIEFGGSYDIVIDDGGGLCSVGGIDPSGDISGISGPVDGSCEPINFVDEFVEPTIDCASLPDGKEDPLDSSRLLPGVYPGNGAFTHISSFPPNGYTKLASGTYCITEGGFRMNSGTLVGNGVLIYVEEGEVIVNTDGVQLFAPTSGDYENLLFVLPSSNDSAVTLNGNATNQFTGTILAPSSEVTLNGGSSTTGFSDTRIISDTAKLNGSAAGIINFNPNNAWIPQVPPQIEFIE